MLSDSCDSGDVMCTAQFGHHAGCAQPRLGSAAEDTLEIIAAHATGQSPSIGRFWYKERKE